MAKRQAQPLQGNLPTLPPKYVPKTDVPIPNDLPVLVRGQKLSEGDIIRVAKFVCEIYATNTYPLHDCLKFAGVKSEATYHFWKRDYKAVKDLHEAATRAKSLSYRNQVRELAWDSLKKQINGYTVDLDEVSDTIEFVEQGIDSTKGNRAEPMGAHTITTRTIKKKKVYVRPSPTLTMFVLNNLDRENFERLPTRETPNPDGVNIPLIQWVD